MLTLDADALLRLAGGRHKPPADHLVARLNQLCDELVRAPLSLTGRRVIQGELVRSLSQSVEVTTLTAPKLIIVVGMPRAGTTLFHHLAAATGTVWTIPFWSALHPGTPERRAREGAATYLATLDLIAPDVRRLHPMTVEGPEECATGRQLTLLSERFWYLAPVHRYLELIESDPREVWRAWIEVVGSLYKASQDLRPVLLKDPSHLGRWMYLDPPPCDVSIVRFFRDPADAAWSFAALMRALRGMTAPAPPDHADTYREASLWLARRLNTEVAWNNNPPFHVVDVYYSEFIQHPEQQTVATLQSCGVNVDCDGDCLNNTLRQRPYLRPTGRQRLQPPPPPRRAAESFERFRHALGII
jgi:hypothetical protein